MSWCKGVPVFFSEAFLNLRKKALMSFPKKLQKRREDIIIRIETLGNPDLKSSDIHEEYATGIVSEFGNNTLVTNSMSLVRCIRDCNRIGILRAYRNNSSSEISFDSQAKKKNSSVRNSYMPTESAYATTKFSKLEKKMYLVSRKISNLLSSSIRQG